MAWQGSVQNTGVFIHLYSLLSKRLNNCNEIEAKEIMFKSHSFYLCHSESNELFSPIYNIGSDLDCPSKAVLVS